MSPLRIAILDDHPLILQGIRQLLELCQVPNVWAGGFTSFDALQTLLNNEPPDLLLLDLNLGQAQDGAIICKQLRQQYPKLIIVILSSLDQATVVKHLLKQGANGFLVKNMGWEELDACLSSVVKGETYIQPSLQKNILDEALGKKSSQFDFIPQLTKREKEILQLIADEKTTSEIAELLFISAYTVETHRNNLLTKLGARNVAGLIKIAIEKGII